MVDIIKSVISAGGYKLADIQHKIKKLYILGDLTEAQMDELLNLSQYNATADAERPETLAILLSLAERISAIEKKLAGQEDTEGEQAEYETWTPWDGVSNQYQYGSIVSHNGELWISDYRGHNVWQPGAVGTESLWVKYE